jgi:hypothetical protein
MPTINTSVDDLRSDLQCADTNGRLKVLDLHLLVVAEQQASNRSSVIKLLDSWIRRLERRNRALQEIVKSMRPVAERANSIPPKIRALMSEDRRRAEASQGKPPL